MTLPETCRRWLPRQADFDAFARLSGDDNPIHCDAAYAAAHPFGARVAHGMLLWSRLCDLPGAAAGPSPQQILLRFPAPAYAGEPLDLTVTQGPEGPGARALRADGTLVCELLWPESTPAPLLPEPAASTRTARTTRHFNEADLRIWEGLSGQKLRGTEVPQPLVASLFSRLLGTDLPGPGTGWLRQRLHFHAKAFVNEALTAEVKLAGLRPEKRLADLFCICFGQDGRVICTGAALMLLAPGDIFLFSSDL